MATQADISFHYDVDNEFYGLFLDNEYRVYSCAVWDGVESLEAAQKQKLARLCRFAGVRAGQRIIDVGCGWGGLMRYAVETIGAAKATGLTLSNDQFNYVSGQQAHGISVLLEAWSEYHPTQLADAVVSVGAFEHFASREDRKRNEHRAVYRNFFEWCSAVSAPNASLGLQTIVTLREPRNIQELRDTRYLLEKVFPGSALPSIEDVHCASAACYEVIHLHRIGQDYVRTLRCWRKRLQSCERMVRDRYGDALFEHYVTYFLAAERSFAAGIVDLLQLSLRKTNALAA